jgi:hypothetical protein
MRDEAPAATTGGFNGKECDRTGIAPAGLAGFNPRSDPISLVAAEIHLGLRPAGICDGWPHCNIQVACQNASEQFIIKSIS